MSRILAAVAVATALTAACGIAQGPRASAQPDGDTATCESATHPIPVVLLHGTLDSAVVWNVLAPQLTAAGYCVYAPTYGVAGAIPGLGGVAPVAESATEISSFLDRVLTTTGAGQVDIVGHSQGGTITEYLAKNGGRSSRIRSAILLAPVSHGTTLSGAVEVATAFPGLRELVDSTVLPTFCAGCADLETGSDFITALGAGPLARPGVRYAVLATRDDVVATPAGPASFITEPGVTNQYVQDLNPQPVSHKDLPRDATAVRWILENLGMAT
ncbi:esterase/lipase family protein [Nocardia sp. NPDC056952]|uniref:esterase/lipase family protein n=1 Tax=Nocardia sp. NPDC056952 TaxID=3345979 RepID=UPI003638F1F4